MAAKHAAPKMLFVDQMAVGIADASEKYTGEIWGNSFKRIKQITEHKSPFKNLIFQKFFGNSLFL